MNQKKNSNILLEDHVYRRLKAKVSVVSDLKSMLPLYFLGRINHYFYLQ